MKRTVEMTARIIDDNQPSLPLIAYDPGGAEEDADDELSHDDD